MSELAELDFLQVCIPQAFLLSNQVLVFANPCLCFLCELGVNSLCEKERAHPATPPAVGDK